MSTETPAEPRGLNLLVVDDEPGQRATLAANLELEGFRVTTAAGAAEALALLDSAPFDLVLSDVRMPGTNGVQLFREIKARNPGTPVVLMTAFALEDLLREAVESGVFTVLTKPFSMEQLMRVVSCAVRKPVVLIVDDEVPVAVTLAASLELAGVRAVAVFDGPSALAAADAQPVDVCVVDMVMPGMDGCQVADELLRSGRCLTVIAVSGHSVPEMLSRVSRFGAIACMVKPLDPSACLSAVARARRNDEAPARPAVAPTGRSRVR